MVGVLPLAAAAAAVLVTKTRNVARLAEGPAAPPSKPKTIFIDAFTSVRFLLISYIVCGHFIGFASPGPLAFKLTTQINVIVGAFFLLSGYVMAYSSCEVGEKKAKDKQIQAIEKSAPGYILARVFGYWPLHFAVLLLFSPMFIYADYIYNGPLITAAHGLMATTLTQAWFPMHAEIWNAPTWFLGATTFVTVLQPYFLPILSKQGKKELRRTAVWLTLFLLIPRIGYCYDNNAWGLLEGAMSPKAFKNLAIFNSLRFNPIWAVFEVMLGFVACRLVMLDGTDGEKKPGVSLTETLGPLIGMIAIVVLRATGVVALSDMLTRSLIFMPLFSLFLMGLHRASVQLDADGKQKITDPVAKLLNLKPLIWLGNLSFPIFVVHGPLGQLFYKKAIASKIFGGPCNIVFGPWFFYVFLGAVVASAFLLNKFVMGSDKVKKLSGWIQGKIVQYC